MTILAIDPGNKHTAMVWFRKGLPIRHEYLPNEQALELLRDTVVEHIVCEMVACYGMAVGHEVFDTCVWIGRFTEAARGSSQSLMFRKDVKLHLCGQTRAKDANVRQALMDRYGRSRAEVMGTKKKPGPLYGISGDLWAALGVAVTYYDLHMKESA